MKRSLMVLSVIMMVVLVAATEAPALSSWFLLTEREWVPEVFGFGDSFDGGLGDTFFLGAGRQWRGRFSGFVGLGVTEYDYPGFRPSSSVLAGFIYNPSPGISLSLEFGETGMDDNFNEPDDQVVTFRTVITF